MYEPYRPPPPLSNGQSVTMRPRLREPGEPGEGYASAWVAHDVDGSIIDMYPSGATLTIGTGKDAITIPVKSWEITVQPKKEPMYFKHEGKVKIVGKPLVDGGSSMRLVVSQESDRTYDQIVLDWIDADEARALSRYFRNMADKMEGKASKVSRTEVYEALDGERDYQDSLGADRSDGQPRSVGDYLTMFRSYLAKADAAWTDNPGDAQALDVIRKLGGIAVHCMEDHGAPKRKVS